jgi:hypothetical protein
MLYEGIDAGGLSKQALAQTSIYLKSHSVESSGSGFRFKEDTKRNMGDVAAKVVMLGLYNDRIQVNAMKLPFVVICLAFDKLYNWFSDADIFDDMVASFRMNNALTSQWKHCLEEVALHRRKVQYERILASVPELFCGAMCQPTVWQEFETLVDEFKQKNESDWSQLMSPCPGCHNMSLERHQDWADSDIDADRTTTPCQCTNQGMELEELSATFPMNRLILTATTLHVAVSKFMELTGNVTAPATKQFITTIRKIIASTDKDKILRSVFDRMRLPHLRNVMAGTTKICVKTHAGQEEFNVVIDVCGRDIPHGVNPEGSVWERVADRQSYKYALEDLVIQALSTMSQEDQGLFLEVGTGSAIPQVPYSTLHFHYALGPGSISGTIQDTPYSQQQFEASMETLNKFACSYPPSVLASSVSIGTCGVDFHFPPMPKPNTQCNAVRLAMEGIVATMQEAKDTGVSVRFTIA